MSHYVRFLAPLFLFLTGLTACHHDSPAPAPQLVSYKVSTLAGSTPGWVDGVGAAARFWEPSAVALDAQGNLYVADRATHRIRKVTPAGEVTTLAGGGSGVGFNHGSFADGVGAEARFYTPQGIAVDQQGNVYVGDTFNHRIRKITPAGVVTTLAGHGQSGSFGSGGYADGPGSIAQFFDPVGVAIDAQGTLYVADYGNERIRKISPAGIVSTLAGSGVRGGADGPGSTAQFYTPQGIAVDQQGNVYVTESFVGRVRKITPAGMVSTLAGTGEEGYAEGPGSTAQFYNAWGIAVDAQGMLYVADSGNNRIRQITKEGVVSTLAGTGEYGITDGYAYSQAQFGSPRGIAISPQGVIYVTEYNANHIRVITPQYK